MKKFQSVLVFQYMREIEVCLQAEDHEAAQSALDDLYDHLESVRDQWWKDNKRTFNAIRKTLRAFYAQAWNSKFRHDKKMSEALSRYTNLIMDQFVLGGDPLGVPDDLTFAWQRRNLTGKELSGKL